MARSKEHVRVTFCGQAADDVTGSMIYIESPHRKILLECGLYQNAGDALEAYKINTKKFKFKPREIDYVFVMHNHVDHVGLTPRLYAEGCQAPLIMPKGSREITKILMKDSARIMEDDAMNLSVQYKRNYRPVYSTSDVDAAMYHYTEYDIGKEIALDEYIKIQFFPSGHILNSAQILLTITDGNLTKRIGYTSDLGNTHIKKYYTNKFAPLPKCDLLIGETTYARETRVANSRMRKKDMEKLECAVRQTCIEHDNRCLIPCFANDRTQNMLTYLYDIFGNDEDFKVPILVDSPMSAAISEAYSNILTGKELEKWEAVKHWSNVKFVRDAQDSRAWMESGCAAVILASSGMMTNGRSVFWSKGILPNPDDRIVFCGYAAEDSLASIIKRGEAKYIKIHGRRFVNKCQITDLHSFTSHMQRDDLLKVYSGDDYKKVVLVHGETAGRVEFAKELQDTIYVKDRTGRVVVASVGYEINV